MSEKKVILKKHEEHRIVNGHLWVFSNEVFKIEQEPESGDIVSVYDGKNTLFGFGFYNKHSLIAVRILSQNPIADLKELFRQRLQAADQLRNTFYPERQAYRMVFSESDFLPGLIIDKYKNTFVLQVYSAGMERNLAMLVEILRDDFSAQNIFTMHEEYFRRMEGLPSENQILLGNQPDEVISDGSLLYEIDFSQTQKTGFYFDQSDNRFFIEKVVKDKSVLDAFCNSGGFGLHAFKGGAASVDFVDSSSTELEKAKKNYLLNQFTNPVEFHKRDVFEYLEMSHQQNRKWDVVCIDPPAFAKNKKTLKTAEKGYEKLNRLALKATKANGYLVTSSCSFHLKKNEFLSLISKAAVKEGKKIQLVHFNEASIDHPKLSTMEETSYLKFAVFRVFE